MTYGSEFVAKQRIVFKTMTRRRKEEIHLQEADSCCEDYLHFINGAGINKLNLVATRIIEKARYATKV